MKTRHRPVRIGIGGPVGTGKTALVWRLCESIRDRYDMAVITNDIYTLEDSEFLVRNTALAADRILGVETGGCPHSAIRDDPSMNFEAIRDLEHRHLGLDLILIESGGDNLSATFSPELVDASVFVIDVSGGDKIPRKGGPGTSRSDLLIINKIDLAPMVGASLEVMARDARIQRGERPTLFTNLRDAIGVADVIAWIDGEVARHRTASGGITTGADVWLERVQEQGLPAEYMHTHGDGTTHAHQHASEHVH